ncbi:hypothetical protein QYF61_015465, partial [Mycteria americana]
MSLMSSLALVTIRSSIASPRVGVSITWVKKLSSMHSRSLLDCLQLAVLLFQQMLGWLKSPSRTRACEREASCSWRKKASSVALLIRQPVIDTNYEIPFVASQEDEVLVLRNRPETLVHKKPGGGPARTADPNWPKGYSIPYGVMLSIETGGSCPGSSDRCSGTGWASVRCNIAVSSMISTGSSDEELGSREKNQIGHSAQWKSGEAGKAYGVPTLTYSHFRFVCGLQ